MTDQDIEKILHRAAELQGQRTQTLDSRAATSHEEQRQLAFVAEAAEEAGISRQDFAFATAEAVGSPGLKPVDPQAAARGRKWLAAPDRAVSIEARLEVPPAEVLATVKGVLAGSEYQVAFTNVVGEDPLVDGVLVFEPADMWQVSLGQYNQFRYIMATADFRQVLMTIRPDPAAANQSVVRFHVSLDHAARLNHMLGRPLAIGTGFLVGIGLAALLWGALPAPAALTLGAAGALATYLGIKASLGALYRWATQWGQKALTGLISRVNLTWRLKGL